MRTIELASSALVALLVAASPGLADESFDVRLSPAPRDASMKNVVAGHGAAHVVLAGRTLAISGTFEGFATPATRGELRRGVAVAVRGPAIRALTVSTATEGSFGAEITLTEDELGALNAGQLYIEIASQSAPQGSVWGWLLPASAPIVRDR